MKTTKSMEVCPWEEDFPEIFHFQQWLHVLASPRILQAMQRLPTQEHLLIMLDAYLPYARSERRLSYGSKIWYPDPQKREARSLDLRAAIERWSSPAISGEITEAARALLREDGISDPEEGWDAHVVEPEPPVENYLVWPESPQLHRKREKPEDVARAIVAFFFPDAPPDLPQISTGDADEDHESG